MNNPLGSLNQPPVRDLAWMMASPGMLSEEWPGYRGLLVPDRWCQQEVSAREPDLQLLDRTPTSLTQYLTRLEPGARLGRYFETLVAYWIETFLKPTRFSAGLAIRKGRQTLGEFDFVFKDPSQARAQHWETSVKFYLFSPGGKGVAPLLRDFVGTEVRDRLDLKLAKLFDQQLKLSQKLEAEPVLLEAGFEKVESRAWVKGVLFYPSTSDWRKHPAPPEISLGHERGWWTSVDPCQIPQTAKGSRFVLLEKYRWLSPLQAWLHPEFPDLLTPAALREHCEKHFATQRQALMVSEVLQDEAEGPAQHLPVSLWREVSRGLIVDKEWAVAARTSSEEDGV